MSVTGSAGRHFVDAGHGNGGQGEEDTEVSYEGVAGEDQFLWSPVYQVEWVVSGGGGDLVISVSGDNECGRLFHEGNS